MWPTLAGQALPDRGAPARYSAGAGTRYVGAAALPHLSGTPSAESRAVGPSADLVCAECALATPGRSPACESPDRGPDDARVTPCGRQPFPSASSRVRHGPYRLRLKVGKNPPFLAAYFCE